jgi:hypothetical protein
VIIPGHGKVLRDREYLTLETELIQSLVTQVRDAVKRGLSLEGTRKALDLTSFRQKMAAGSDKQRSADFVLPASARPTRKRAASRSGRAPTRTEGSRALVRLSQGE